MALDWSNIILGLLTLLGGCGWLLDRKKHRQEVEGLKADNRQKDMELSLECQLSCQNSANWHIYCKK